MKVLVIGAGVIGTVYGAQLAATGHGVSVLGHGPRTDAVAREGLCARDVLTGVATDARAAVVEQASDEKFDLVLVALRRENLHLVSVELSKLCADPLVLFFGNNPQGRAGLPPAISASACMGFPGVGGTLQTGVAEYVRIPQQPTTLEDNPDPRLGELQDALASRGFPVERVADMSGWLAYHAVFVACISSALYHCQTDPLRLAGDRRELTLMCQAITEGFQALRVQGVVGLPRNLAVLHSRWLRPVAVRYWARSMRSPMGELTLAAHSRHAEPEMRALAHDVVNHVVQGATPPSLHRLLTSPRPG
jgi:2-dehydropantoate 2-reductase